MKIYRIVAFLLAALLIASLSACKRPIPGNSGEFTSTPEAGASDVTAGATDVLEQIYLFATQTAMATQGITTGVPQAVGTESPVAPGAQTTPAAPSTQPVVEAPVIPSPVPMLGPVPPLVVPASYTLHKGEFPYCLARRFNVDPGVLLSANGLTSYSVYYSGMTLAIPQGARGFPGNRALRPHPATYTVRPGDTIFSIACAFGDVDPYAIISVNGLPENGKVSPGEVLQIP